jgi:hypothetical protein
VSLQAPRVTGRRDLKYVTPRSEIYMEIYLYLWLQLYFAVLVCSRVSGSLMCVLSALGCRWMCLPPTPVATRRAASDASVGAARGCQGPRESGTNYNHARIFTRPCNWYSRLIIIEIAIMHN